MDSPREALARRYFDVLTARDPEAVAASWAPDVVLDRRNSNAPWRGIARGRYEARAFYEEWIAAAAETLADFRWDLEALRAVGADFVAAGTRISGRGRSSGIATGASGGWLLRYEGDLVAEAVLYQSFEEALLAARRRALAAARLYLVCEAMPGGRDPSSLLEAAIAGGVEVIQLREKAPRCAEELVAFADPFARAAREHGVIFFLNDHPELVRECGADGVHVGQDDTPVAEARATAGTGALVGLSTHSREQLDAALDAEGAARPDQVSVGPVWETPTKPGRPAAGLELVTHAAERGADVAWFAIGGIEPSNVGEVVEAGARRIVVVRAIADADDPEAAARALREALPAIGT